MPKESGKAWHLSRNGERSGPYTSQQLAEMGTLGRITSDMAVWREGMATWQPVSKVKGLKVVEVPAAPPPALAAPAIAVAVTPAPSASPMPIKGHVTIEKTRKSLKLQQLLGLFSILIGLSLIGAAVYGREPDSKEMSPILPMGSLLFLVGLVWRVVTRIRIWWHHG